MFGFFFIVWKLSHVWSQRHYFKWILFIPLLFFLINTVELEKIIGVEENVAVLNLLSVKLAAEIIYSSNQMLRLI